MSKRYRLPNLALEAAMILAAVVYVFPLYVLIQLSFRSMQSVAQSPLALPNFLYWENYVRAWSSAALGKSLINSTIITVLSVALLVVLGSLAAYVLARRKERLSYGVYLLFLAGIIVPLQLGLIPLYRLVRDLHLLGTHASLVLFYAGHFLPLVVFLYTGFLRVIPREYEEAALVDGANHAQVFTRIVFPLLRPITGTVVIINSVFIWNDFLTPLLYLGGTNKTTIPVAIYQFVGQYDSQWGLVFAGLIIGSVPILVLYFLLQRHVIKGFASGLKG